VVSTTAHVTAIHVRRLPAAADDAVTTASRFFFVRAISSYCMSVLDELQKTTRQEQ